jgi:hypothetical protein
MGVALEVPPRAAIELPDLIAAIERTLDYRDDATLLSLAPDLAALARHPTFLADHLTRELSSPDQFQRGSAYSGASFVLARGKNWIVRANLWEPIRADIPGGSGGFSQQLGMYALLHDHDFSFVTVGYFGPGYETTLFECEPERIEGYVGEQVDLRPLGKKALPAGALLYFERRRHVHEQSPPVAPSVSVNVISLDPETPFVSQYYIDQATSRIVARTSDAFNGRNLLCDLAAALGDARSSAPLAALARSHPSAGLRVQASRALAELSGPDARSVWHAAEGDPHPLVRRAAREALADLERGQ